MRRRTKPRVVWLPPDPTNRLIVGGNLASPDGPAIGTGTIPITGDYSIGGSSGNVYPLAGDYGNAESLIIGLPGQATNTLSDLYNSGYRLRRICGSFFACLEQNDQTGVGGSVILTAGMYVGRVNASSSQAPVDAEAAPPDTYENQNNPWIWRRSWALTNFAMAAGVKAPLGLSNTYTGSVREGSFIDQKTARIIGPEERLFLSVSATMCQDELGKDTFVFYCWNLRFLASLKTNVGNRRNASR